MSDCSVTGCERPAHARGYCGAHYRRWARGREVFEPVIEQLTPRQRAFEASLAMVNMDSDDDASAATAEENWRKAVSRWRDPMVFKEVREAQATSGRMGGITRAQNLSPERRSEIARIAAQARAAASPEERRRIAKNAAQARWRNHACLGGKQACPPPKRKRP